MILSLILWFPDISQHLFLFFSKGPKHLFLVPFLKGAFKTRSSRAGCTFKLVGRQPAKPLVLASSGRSPSQTPNQQASLFMSACYCWAVFRNKRKLKSLAVRRHPELTEGWGAAEDGGGNERQKFLSFPAGVFQIPQATALSAVRVNSERGNSREPREEESRILERTRHLRTDQRRLASVCNRLLSTSSGCSSCSLTHNVPAVPLLLKKQDSGSTQATVHHCETLNGVGAVNQHELGYPTPASPH